MTRVAGWLWRSYFRPRRWEAGGRIYERLGVRKIKELYFGGRYMNAVVSALRGRRYRPFSGRNWLLRWLRFTVIVEVGHSGIALYMLFSAVTDIVIRDWSAAVATVAINIAVNIYPVMVQRYNRVRLLRIMELRSSSRTAAHPISVLRYER